MYQVKTFDEEHEDDLQEVINAFLKDNPDIELYDIKFSNALAMEEDTQIYCFSALLIYRT